MKIRGMVREDQSFIRLKAEAYAAELYPEFIPDMGKEIEILRRAEYVRVIGEVGKPHSALIALAGQNAWATKRHASVLLWFGAHGGGLKLLLDFKRWVRQQNILVAAVTDDHGLADDAKAVLKATGFEQRGGTYMFFPKGSKR